MTRCLRHLNGLLWCLLTGACNKKYLWRSDAPCSCMLMKVKHELVFETPECALDAC